MNVSAKRLVLTDHLIEGETALRRGLVLIGTTDEPHQTNKGITMENTTVNTELSPFEQQKLKASEKIASMSFEDITGYIAGLKITQDELQHSIDNLRKINFERKQAVKQFIVENYESGASTDDLKSLAEELDIELTKTVTVEFTVSYSALITVSIDYDTDQISESDFDVEVSFNGDSDTELNTDEYDIDNFNVIDND